MKYKYTAKEAKKFNKYGIDLINYGINNPALNIVHVHLSEGHFEEFYNVRSTFIYYIIKGKGTYFLNDEKVEVKATDLIVIPPNTRIHYFGFMDMILMTSPAYSASDEHHVRFVDKKENPYL